MRKVWVAFETRSYRTAEIDWDELRALADDMGNEYPEEVTFTCPPENEVFGRTGTAIPHQVPSDALWDRLMELSDWEESAPLTITEIARTED